MTLRIIHVWSENGEEHVFTFLVLDDGIAFEFASEAVPLFECATDIAPWVN